MRKWRGKGGSVRSRRWHARAHLEPLPRALGARRGPRAAERVRRARSPAGRGTSRCCRRCRRGGRRCWRARAAPTRAWCSPRATRCCGCGEAISVRNPDVLKANGGGCNAILVRGPAILGAPHGAARAAAGAALDARRAAGERRCWVVNLHATTRKRLRAAPQTRAEVRFAAGTGLAWAGGAPLVLGGDLNLPDPGERRAAPRRRPLGRPRLRQRAGARGPRRGARPRHALRPQAGGRRSSRCVARSRAASAARAGRRCRPSGTRRAGSRRRGRRRTRGRAAAGPRAAPRRRRRAASGSGRSRRSSRAARGGCRAACTARTRRRHRCRRSPVLLTRASGKASHRRFACCASPRAPCSGSGVSGSSYWKPSAHRGSKRAGSRPDHARSHSSKSSSTSIFMKDDGAPAFVAATRTCRRGDSFRNRRFLGRRTA